MRALRYMVSTGMTGLLMLAANAAIGQDFPAKPIRIIAGPAGGGNDIHSRIITPVVSRFVGQPVIVDNRSSTLIASEAASRAAPDGYTVLYNGQSMWVSPLLQKVPYEVADFAPIAQVAREIYILSVHPSLPVRSAKDLVALAKARPGQLSYGTSAPATGGHLAGELFKSMAGVNILWVPYKGIAPAITATVSGEVQIVIAGPGTMLPQLKAGRLKALGITTSTPSALLPDMPTITATGLPGYEMVAMTGMFAPAKTAPQIVNRLNQEFVRALNTPEVKEKFLGASIEVITGSPEQFSAAINADTGRMAKVIKEANIRLE